MRSPIVAALIVAALLAACSGTPDVSALDGSPHDARLTEIDARPSMDTSIDAPSHDAFALSEDAFVCDDWVSQNCPPPPPPPRPTGLVPPTPACGSDAGPMTYYPYGCGGDPCMHFVDCVDGYAVTYTGGSCVTSSDASAPSDAGAIACTTIATDHHCVFTTPPTLAYCYAGCAPGPSGRCLHVGSTGP